LQEELKAAGKAVGSFLVSGTVTTNVVSGLYPHDPLTFDVDHQMLSTFVKMDPSQDWFTGLSSYNISQSTMFSMASQPYSAGRSNRSTFWDDDLGPCDTTLNFTSTGGAGFVQSMTNKSVPGFSLFRSDNATIPVAQWECHTHEYGSAGVMWMASSPVSIMLMVLTLLSWR
jgi:hypothetical protein